MSPSYRNQNVARVPELDSKRTSGHGQVGVRAAQFACMQPACGPLQVAAVGFSEIRLRPTLTGEPYAARRDPEDQVGIIGKSFDDAARGTRYARRGRAAAAFPSS